MQCRSQRAQYVGQHILQRLPPGLQQHTSVRFRLGLYITAHLLGRIYLPECCDTDRDELAVRSCSAHPATTGLGCFRRGMLQYLTATTTLHVYMTSPPPFDPMRAVVRVHLSGTARHRHALQWVVGLRIPHHYGDLSGHCSCGCGDYSLQDFSAVFHDCARFVVR